jgi:peptide/nickel transport system substrate-binding protein
MRVRNAVIAAAVAATIGMAQGAEAKEFRWAFQGDAQSLDPYSLNETFTLGFLGNVYEGLTQRGPELEIMPALAESWEIVEPTRWRFQLRQGVKFHNGNDFNADDVVFSFNRIQAEGSDLQTRIPGGTKIEKVDDHTVDIITDGPNPILINDWDSFYIMDKEWSEANDATAPTSVTEGKENYAAFNANGTGPFKIESRERDVRTVFVPNDNYWGDVNTNVTKGIFTPISSDATRVAALLSGEIDMMYPVPVQDMNRINDNSGTSVLSGPELRTIFLGFDQMRDELLYSDVKGKNPFQDVRVRKAFYHSIDIEAIKAKVMRGLSTPSALMISPFLFSRSDEYERFAYDPDQAKDLLAEAGYADGFQVGMDCPNNRYVNDEAICQAVVAMLARVGVEVDLLAQPKAQYFAKVLGPKYDTSFFLLGWTPGTFDSHNVLFNLHGCHDPETGSGKFNLGGYCNPEVDELTAAILVETDTTERDDLIKQAYDITTSEVAHIPLHQQAVAWAKKDSVDLVQRADNVFMLYHVNVE